MNENKVKKAFGTHEVARLCHVTPPTVIRWMEEGKLQFFTTGGGHRRVWDTGLAAFMREHNIPVPPELQAAAPLRILIVDDDAEIRGLVKRLLAREYPQAEVAEAMDGFEAGAKLYSFRPSLILLDLQLPMLDGFKVCAMIREDEDMRDVKILATTGYDPVDSGKEILAAGADEFLAKPFELAELSERLRRLVRARAQNGR